MGSILFYVAAALVLIGATLVLTTPNPLRAAVALILSLGSLSVIYLLLRAEFVAVMQLLVYAGAIIVLFVFVIMLLNIQGQIEASSKRIALTTTLILSFVLFFACVLSHLFLANQLPMAEAPTLKNSVVFNFGSVESLAGVVLGHYAIPFEMLSILLLVAVLGAVAIAKKRL